MAGEAALAARRAGIVLTVQRRKDYSVAFARTILAISLCRTNGNGNSTQEQEHEEKQSAPVSLTRTVLLLEAASWPSGERRQQEGRSGSKFSR